MAATRSGLRKVGLLILVAFVLLLFDVFLLFRPVLILPSMVKSRISLDYTPPYPSQIELPVEVPVTISPGQFGMPDEHWGARAVRTERPEPEDTPEDGFLSRPAFRRLTYCGDKLTEELVLVKRDRTAPWNNPWAPWRPTGLGFGVTYFPPDVPEGMWFASPLDLWIGETLQRLPAWFCAWAFFWTKEPVYSTAYAYDDQGHLVEQWEANLWRPTRGIGLVGPTALPEEPKVRATRTIYDDQDKKIGELLYKDGKLAYGRLEVLETGGEVKSEYNIHGWADGFDITVFRRPATRSALEKGLPTWSARYSMQGKLQADASGVAGQGHFHKAGQSVWTSVHFDASGCVVENDAGAAAHRGYSNESGTWHVSADYDASGRLTHAGYMGAASQYRANKLLPFATQSYYKPNRWISHLYFDTYPIGPFGVLRTMRLIALLVAGPAFGIMLVCLISHLRSRTDP
ncbi:MAG: hypothetical protein JW889_05860 [Verrucomicrobia bacterium]|nr:hypothetical protein [Verrucomicrobiota bacterium]